MQMILQQAQKMQQQLMTAQVERAAAEVIGQVGIGLVHVILIVGASQDDARAAQELQAETMVRSRGPR